MELSSIISSERGIEMFTSIVLIILCAIILGVSFDVSNGSSCELVGSGSIIPLSKEYEHTVNKGKPLPPRAFLHAMLAGDTQTLYKYSRNTIYRLQNFRESCNDLSYYEIAMLLSKKALVNFFNGIIILFSAVFTGVIQTCGVFIKMILKLSLSQETYIKIRTKHRNNVTYSNYIMIGIRGCLLDIYLYLLARGLRWKKVDPITSWSSKKVNFYTRHVYQSIEDCWNIPCSGVPAGTIRLINRSRGSISREEPYGPMTLNTYSMDYTEDYLALAEDVEKVMDDDIKQKGLSHYSKPCYAKDISITKTAGELQIADVAHCSSWCLNLGSYNYLGYGGTDPICTPTVFQEIQESGISPCGTSRCYADGNVDVLYKLEASVASFLYQEDAIVFGMGFATNSTVLPWLVKNQGTPGSILAFSDVYNHKSIVEGLRLSGAEIRSFPHNDMKKLRKMMEIASTENWSQIIVIVEGVYSMEGTFVDLPNLIKLRDDFKFFIWLDEAHSIGAIGATGRGTVEHFNLPWSCLDIYMGTFSKSFGSAGGYIAGNSKLMQSLRESSSSYITSTSFSPPHARQVLTALEILTGVRKPTNQITLTGKERVSRLQRNSNYLRAKLMDYGLEVLGCVDSPVVPFIAPSPYFVAHLSRRCREHQIALVMVGYPATPMCQERSRLCVSASHTLEQIDYAARIIELCTRGWGNRFWSIPNRKIIESEPKLKAALEIHIPLNGDITKSFALPNLPLPEKLDIVPKRRNKKVLLGGCDPLGLWQEPLYALERDSQTRLYHYGCGACGPRGFFGGSVIHLSLENILASALSVGGTVVYSHSSALVSSIINAFITSTNIVFVDESCNYQTRCGLRLCRPSSIIFYKHCDMQDLERLMEENISELSKPFIISEGIFYSTGKICPLPEIIELKNKYNAQVILDDTIGFASIGENGLGTPDYHNLPHSSIDMYVGSLEHGIASVGGFCAGSLMTTNHQRLSSSGFTFSAAAPAYAMSWAFQVVRSLYALKHTKTILENKYTSMEDNVKNEIVETSSSHQIKQLKAKCFETCILTKTQSTHMVSEKKFVSSKLMDTPSIAAPLCARLKLLKTQTSLFRSLLTEVVKNTDIQLVSSQDSPVQFLKIPNILWESSDKENITFADVVKTPETFKTILNNKRLKLHNTPSYEIPQLRMTVSASTTDEDLHTSTQLLKEWLCNLA